MRRLLRLFRRRKSTPKHEFNMTPQQQAIDYYFIQPKPGETVAVIFKRRTDV